jgi:hypothetical protein
MMRRSIIIRIATITGARRLRGIGATIDGMRTREPRIPLMPGKPIPLAVCEAPCFFQQRALAALDKACVPWRIAFTRVSHCERQSGFPQRCVCSMVCRRFQTQRSLFACTTVVARSPQHRHHFGPPLSRRWRGSCLRDHS